MKKNVAVVGAEVSIVTGGVSATSISITSPAKLKGRVSAKKIYAGGVSFTASGVTNGTCTATAPVTGTIDPKATKAKLENSLVNRQDDNIIKTNIPGITAQGASCTIPSVEFKITDAGQDKMRAE